MPENLGQAVLKLKTDSSQFDKGMKSAETRAQGLGKKFSSIGKRMSAAVTLPIAGAAVAAGKAASDLEESMNAVNVVFGDSAGKIEAWGETAAETAGIAQAEFNQAATTLGSMLQNVGMSADEAAEKSINLTQRAADMASVFNTDVDQALGAIQAGIRGEIDPLERFGVSLNMASVRAHAVEEGMAAAGEELTAAQKTTARLSLIMEQTNDVAGDFANTSDQTANSFRQLKAETIDVAAELGQQLLPMFNKIIGAASSVVDWLGDLSESQRTLLLAVSGAAAALGPLAIGIGAVTTAMTTLMPVMTSFVGILTGPAGLVALVVGAAAGLAAMTDRSKEAQQGIKGFNNVYGNIEQNMQAAKEANRGIEESMSEQEKIGRRMMRVSQIHESLTTNRLGAQKQIADAIERQLKAQERLNGMRAKIVNSEEQLIDRLSTIDKLFGKGIFNKQEALNKKIEARQGLIESIQQRALERGRVLDVESEIIERMRSNIERYREALEGATGEMEEQADAAGDIEDSMKNLPTFIAEGAMRGADVMGQRMQALAESMRNRNIEGLIPSDTYGGDGKQAPGALKQAGQILLQGAMKFLGFVKQLIMSAEPVRNVLEMITTAMTQGLSPAINAIVSLIRPFIPPLREMAQVIGNILASAFKAMAPAVKALFPLLRIFNTLLKAVGKIIMALMPALEPLVKLLVGVIVPVVDIIASLLVAVAPFLKIFAQVIGVIADIMDSILRPVLISIAAMIKFVANLLHNFGKLLSNIIDHPLNPDKWGSGMRTLNVGEIARNLRSQMDTGGVDFDVSTGELDMDTGTGDGGSQIDQARPITVNVDIYDNELAGEDGFRELAVIIRNELESLGVINA
jgi:phage-related protein